MNLANLAVGPGLLYWAPLGSTLPADTVAGSVFTDAWPAAWLGFGYTDEGSDFSYQPSTDVVEVAEQLDPARIVATGRAISISFALAEINPTNFKRAMNGGNIVTTGSGATTLTTYTPPAVGAEVRCMIGWQSDANDERMIYKQCFQQGNITVSRKKAPAKATIPVEFGLEAPADGSQPFRYSTAGATRI